MFRYETGERALTRSKTRRRLRQNRAISSVLILVAALALSISAWLSLVLSSRRPICWHPFQQRQTSHAGQSGGLRVEIRHLSYNDPHLSVRNLVFGIAGSAKLWPRRKEYVKLWWKPHLRGYVWLEEAVNQDPTEPLPPISVSEDISRFRYTNPTGHPSGIRIARIVQELFKLGLPDVRWFILGDDDTIFCPANLVQILKKYNSEELYYVGNPSESHSSNTYFSHGMAFGGGGIAISYPLARALSQMLDNCLERYPFLFGSDDRLHACISELGVPLTRELGFHQFDVHGNGFGLLAAHPIAPFVSMHHLDEINPVFPELNALDGLRSLTRAMDAYPSSFLQRSICYDHNKGMTFSVSTGYVVQVYPYIVLPRELERSAITFKAWNKRDGGGEFDFDTRKDFRSICSEPFLFFLKESHIEQGNTLISTYKLDNQTNKRKRRSFCLSNASFSKELQQIRVVSNQITDHWFLIPRRQCCKVTGFEDGGLQMAVDSCGIEKASSR